MEQKVKLISLEKSESKQDILEIVKDFSVSWNDLFGKTDIEKCSMSVKKIASVRMLPHYRDLVLPRGSKKVSNALTRNVARKLLKSDTIRFDSEDQRFHLKDLPELKVSGNQITIVESSFDLFADISFDEFISFESQLFDDLYFASKHPVGVKIFDIIKSWNKFVSFDDISYYHACKIEKGQLQFLD